MVKLNKKASAYAWIMKIVALIVVGLAYLIQANMWDTIASSSL